MVIACKSNQIRNPATNRCVKKSGSIGKAILKKRKRRRSKSNRRRSSACKSNQIRNPATNRCVKKTGSIGKAILKKRRTPVQRSPLERSRRQYLRNRYPKTDISRQVTKRYGNIIPNNYFVSKKLGAGEYGIAYLLCSTGDNNCDRVLKVQRLVGGNAEFTNEVAMQKTFARIGLAPSVFSSKTFRKGNSTYGLIVMEKIDGIMEDFLAKEQDTHTLDVILRYIIEFIRKMCTSRLTHGDFHFENFGYILDIRDDSFVAKPLLIDFGWSSSTPCHPDLELIQLLRTTSFIKNRKNKTYLKDQLYILYTNNYNSRLPNNGSAFTREWERIIEAYQDEIDA
jgi:tRNA A-37 threonylcarbamoyl transferase component Bud32